MMIAEMVVTKMVVIVTILDIVVATAVPPHVNVTCQICKIHGHLASDCWWRFKDDSMSDSDDDSNHNDKRANVASTSYGVDTNW